MTKLTPGQVAMLRWLAKRPNGTSELPRGTAMRNTAGALQKRELIAMLPNDHFWYTVSIMEAGRKALEEQ